MNNLDLNPYLFPKDSPYAQNQGATSFYAFDYENEAGIISNGKIRTLTADKITSGTINAGIITISNLSVNPEDITSGTLLTQVNIGTTAGGYLQADGVNNRFVVNDGTTNRIAIGNV